MEAIRPIGSQRIRAKALRELAERLDGKALTTALEIARSLNDERYSVEAFSGLVNAVKDRQTRIALLKELVALAAQLDRPQVLEALEFCVPSLAAVGGQDVLRGLHQTILDTAEWYP